MVGEKCLFQRNYNFSRVQAGGGGAWKMSGGPTFSKVMGPNCFFSIELVVPQGVPDSMYPLWIPALPMCTCLCLWPFKVTKIEARSKFFKGIGHKKSVAKIIFYLLRSFWEIPLVTTKTTLRWLYRDHNFTMILSCLRKLRCIRVSGHNR